MDELKKINKKFFFYSGRINSVFFFDGFVSCWIFFFSCYIVNFYLRVLVSDLLYEFIIEKCSKSYVRKYLLK